MHPLAVDLPETLLGKEFLSILENRGLSVAQQNLEDSAGQAGVVAAKVLSKVPSLREAAILGEQIASHACTGRPVVLFVPPPSHKRSRAHEGAAAIAALRAHGAVVTDDPAIWIECIVLLAVYGLPTGPTVAIVASPDSWLQAAAMAQQRRAEWAGERFASTSTAPEAAATDVVVVDALADKPHTKVSALVVPASGQPQFVAQRPSLVGLASAVAAVELTGQASLRIAAGDGPSPSALGPEDVDVERFQRQIQKLGDSAGDHECKVLLSAYGIDITRQAVATTPSAATRIAKKAGYPVEVKPWGPNQPTETSGCVVQRGLATAADVRRAFASVCSLGDCEAVIVRETPPPGREFSIRIEEQGPLGLMAFLYLPAQVHPAAAMAPLRSIDSDSMARSVVASRASDTDPDWDALSDLLRLASHLVADNDRILQLELPRVILGQEGAGATVVDARAKLTPVDA